SGSGSDSNSSAKPECRNCGATQTPLWRRGLNNELNCNACGLYFKQHNRSRPEIMPERTQRSSSGMHTVTGLTERPAAECFNCQTTTTSLWRKDDEKNTVCNACGLYHKLHGSARPISMKTDVIRRRSR
ncbi:hypothetical protein C8R43DRAFT_831885, partial [Mycena crocata]